MKITIGPYTSWYGPYQLAETLCFWAKPVEDEYGYKRKPDWVHNFGEWLAHGKVEPEQELGEIRPWDLDRKETWLYRFLKWVDSKKKRKIKIKIDKWDTWATHSNLAMIILPMLKQLKETKHGSPFTDMEDVPESMRLVDHEEYEDQKTFEFYHNDAELNKQNIQCDMHDRWSWILDEMIWAFEQLQPEYDWEKQYHSGEHDLLWKKTELGYEMLHGPKDTYDVNMVGLTAHQDRINRGLTLFGKYFHGLSD